MMAALGPGQQIGGINPIFWETPAISCFNVHGAANSGHRLSLSATLEVSRVQIL